MKLRLLLSLKACLKTRPVRAPGLHAGLFPPLACRPCALTRRFGRVFAPALGLLLAWQAAHAQTANDYFHGGAVNYLSNNIPNALEVVTNGRAIFPDDVKLKKLEELLKQQQQQQQAQQEQQQKDEQQKQEEKKEQQSKPDQKDEQKKQEPSKEDQQKQEQQQAKSNEEDKQQKEQQPTTAHAMTPQEAQKLLDAQKGDEKVLQLVPEGEPKNRDRAFKDW